MTTYAKRKLKYSVNENFNLLPYVEWDRFVTLTGAQAEWVLRCRIYGSADTVFLASLFIRHNNHNVTSSGLILRSTLVVLGSEKLCQRFFHVLIRFWSSRCIPNPWTVYNNTQSRGCYSITKKKKVFFDICKTTFLYINVYDMSYKF